MADFSKKQGQKLFFHENKPSAKAASEQRGWDWSWSDFQADEHFNSFFFSNDILLSDVLLSFNRSPHNSVPC